jgi:hypothetical protein
MLKTRSRCCLFTSLPLLAAALSLAGCSSKDGSEVEGGNGSAGASGNGSGGTGQPNNLGKGGNGLGNGGSGAGMNAPITPGSECAKGSAAADAIPAVVQMVIDISGSMLWAPGTEDYPGFGEDSKWDITSEALKDAVAKLPASVAVGLNFYPNNPRGQQCINNQIDLPIALLGEAMSQQRRSFNSAIDGAEPDDGTPTHAAFMFGAETVKASDLAGKTFVLLITDGVPTFNLDCSGDGQTGVDNAPLIAAVDAAFKDASPVSTFVIGSPGSEGARGDLSQMASKGGTAKAGCSDTGPTYCHLDMTTAMDFAAALSAGLAEVAGQIGTCEYAVPPAPVGQELDPSLVNVLYTKADGSQVSIPQDAKGDCSSGWQYDDPAAPTKITLCGTDCSTVQADQGAKIDVIFGCKTETNVPVK